MRKWKKKNVHKLTFIIYFFFFYPFPHPLAAYFIFPNSKSLLLVKWLDQIGYWIYMLRLYIKKALSFDSLNLHIFAYKIWSYFCVPSILETFILESCLLLGSKDHRQFVCLSLSWQELVLLICKQRGCRTSLWNQLYVCVCVFPCVNQTQCY